MTRVQLGEARRAELRSCVARRPPGGPPARAGRSGGGWMRPSGWQQLIPPPPFLRGEGACPIEAVSEFVPPPRVGWKPYGDGSPDPALLAPDDPWGWRVTEYEEAREIQPGLPQIAGQVVREVARLLDGNP